MNIELSYENEQHRVKQNDRRVVSEIVVHDDDEHELKTDSIIIELEHDCHEQYIDHDDDDDQAHELHEHDQQIELDVDDDDEHDEIEALDIDEHDVIMI